MIEVRRFGPENKTPIPVPGVPGLDGVVIQLPQSLANKLGADELEKRYKGKPIVLDQPVTVAALYFDARGEMHEHDAPHPILFLVINGSGFVRVGGPQGEALRVKVGDAVLWPAKILHKAWTNGEPLQAIAIEYLNPAKAH